MPVSTPEENLEEYRGDRDHFEHVLEQLFIPAIDASELEPIPPIMTGSNIIQADIIDKLATSDLVLCDMSNLNPNVFFESGIRTAMDNPVVLTVDELTRDRVPFDTSIINYHEYSSSLCFYFSDTAIYELWAPLARI